jgi:hypothetical protein
MQAITPESLLKKGYTMRGAARAIGRSAPHVYLVVIGKRFSPPVLEALKALPPRPLSLRKNITH